MERDVVERKRLSIDLSYDAYNKLLALAFRKNQPIKCVVEEIIEARVVSRFNRIKARLLKEK